VGSKFTFQDATILDLAHINKIDDYNSTKIPESNLAGDFLCSHQVCSQSGFLQTTSIQATAIDVNGRQGFGFMNHNGTSTF
jgi:hypothetical protein